MIKKYLAIGLIALFCACASAPAASSPDELDMAIREASDYLNGRIPKGDKIAFINIHSDSPVLSEYIIEGLIENTVNDNQFLVVDRQQLDVIRNELNFQYSGEVSDESAQSIGQKLGAKTIITGAVTQMGDLYRLRVRALAVESAQIQGQFSRNIPNGRTIAALLRSSSTSVSNAASRPVTVQTPTASTLPTTPSAPSRFTVTFYANGASGVTPPAQTVQNGESITIPDKGTLTSNMGNFGGWNTGMSGNGTPYAAGSSLVVNANTNLYAQWIEHVFKIGDRGPAGGIIFYDKGNNSGGWRYLEAAPASSEFKAQWGNPMARYGQPMVQTSDALGTGKDNTQRLKGALEELGQITRAAHRCTQLNINGFNDWFLPSKAELSWMYVNLKEKRLGDLSNDWYWSSSFAGRDSWNNARAWIQKFSDGTQQSSSAHHRGDADTHSVRAIRQF